MKSQMKIEGTKIIASAELDPNGDGQPVAKLTLEIDMMEIPDEAMSAVLKKKAEKKA